jgi:protoporphyrinogen oxidase
MSGSRAIIIGAGPAGLTAAYELLERTDVSPIVYEMSGEIGGISRSVALEGNKIDIGGHRFYSPSAKVVEWWLKILPIQGAPAQDDIKRSRRVPLSQEPGAPDPQKEDDVLLVRRRVSRILFLGRFFDYPIALNRTTVFGLGLRRIFRIGTSYLRRKLFPIRPETSLEDFFENTFGRELYETFFKRYTEKVWGVPCSCIDRAWGPQQIQGISIRKTLQHAFTKVFPRGRPGDMEETGINLAVQFLYPKYGPGQMWERVAQIVEERGGAIHLRHRVVALDHRDRQITAAVVRDEKTGETRTVTGDYFFSTMPVADLIDCLGDDVPEDVREVAKGLVYRGFISVELLFRNLWIAGRPVVGPGRSGLPDNWIYIQEPDVELGRIQILNNWSPYLVKDPDTAFVGLEYFADEGDELWSRGDDEMIRFALDELREIGIEHQDLLASLVVKEPKAYPVYRGTHGRFSAISDYVDSFESMFLIGRCGMHVYDSTDVYMLAAMEAVDNIVSGVRTKDNVWGARR